MTEPSSEALRARLQRLFGAEFVIDRELGRGGMAAVFVAHDPALQRSVGIKLLLPQFADDSSIADRFLREGRAMASLDHPNVVAAYAVRSGAGTNAIVMQYVDGASLEQRLKREPAMPVSAAADLLAQVAAGLQHAHSRGIVHRDIKPGNVLVDSHGHARVSDFGIARRDDGQDLTKTGLVLGTTDYMSPEQRSGECVTAATDQYALGVMAYEVFCGRLPFEGTPLDVIRGHMSEAPPSLRSMRADIPPHIDAVVARMMAKAPEDRWPSMQPVVDAFTALARQSDTRGNAASSAGDGPPRVWRAWPAAAALLVFAGAGVWWISRSPDNANRRAPSNEARETVTANAVTPAAVNPAAVNPAAVNPAAVNPAAVNPAAIAQRAVKSADSATVRRAAVAPPAAQPSAVVAAPTPAPTPATAATTTVQGNVPTTAAPAPATSASPSAAAPASAAATPAFAMADARAVGRQIVTWFNQRRTKDLAALTRVGGDEAARAELLRLAERAPDFAVGIDRLASAPSEWARGFQTDTYLDVEWRGGKKIFHVTLYASPADDGWHLVGMGVESTSLPPTT